MTRSSVGSSSASTIPLPAQMASRSGSVTMDQSLRRLVQDRVVSFDTALSYARDREAFRSAAQPY